jgi:putative addiction module component (TIGR02574 family)
MSKIEILQDKPDSEDWLDDEEPLTVREKALLEARLAAYAKDPDAGDTWEEVEGRIRATLISRIQVND